jgi:hypothetical protein
MKNAAQGSDAVLRCVVVMGENCAQCLPAQWHAKGVCVAKSRQQNGPTRIASQAIEIIGVSAGVRLTVW